MASRKARSTHLSMGLSCWRRDTSSMQILTIKVVMNITATTATPS